jgi:thiosulfate/3-mercaptopyruvate sulfurtransferase
MDRRPIRPDHSRFLTRSVQSRLAKDQQRHLVALYGDKNNCGLYAFWVLRLFGVQNLRIMDGGRALWEKEAAAVDRSTPLRHSPSGRNTGRSGLPR